MKDKVVKFDECANEYSFALDANTRTVIYSDTMQKFLSDIKKVILSGALMTRKLEHSKDKQRFVEFSSYSMCDKFISYICEDLLSLERAGYCMNTFVFNVPVELSLEILNKAYDYDTIIKLLSYGDPETYINNDVIEEEVVPCDLCIGGSVRDRFDLKTGNLYIDGKQVLFGMSYCPKCGRKVNNIE